jgi:hypothetical protein
LKVGCPLAAVPRVPFVDAATLVAKLWYTVFAEFWYPTLLKII